MKQRPASHHSTQQAEQVATWLRDLLLGIAVTLVIALVITADQGGSQEPDWIAYSFAVGFGGLMLVRRSSPVLVLVATMFLLFVYYALGYPAIGLAVPVSAALYSAAELGHLSAAIVVSLLLIGVSTYFRLSEGQSIAFVLGYELISYATLMAAALALGDSIRARRALRAEQAATSRLIEQEHTLRTEQQVQAERVRMARELHDVIGHSISVISLHADVAREAVGHNDEQVRQALRHIRTATGETMRELRATVKFLRNAEEESAHSVATLANLKTLVEQAQASGLEVTVEQTIPEISALSAAVDLAAYRILQEALTNVIRHAHATAICIAIEVDAARLRLVITDNGATNMSSLIPGSGITGMQERVRLLGGTFSIQMQAKGGVKVNVQLPLEEMQ